MRPALAKVFEKIRAANLPAFEGVILAHPNVRGRCFGETPLHVVSVWGDMEAARTLIIEGAIIDVPAEHGCTALHEAALQGHAELVRLLISHGADITKKCEFGDLHQIIANSDNPDLRKLGEDLSEGKS